jgi:hypothetical protein
MSRLTTTPGRDLDRPLVEVDPAASLAESVLLRLFRGYLGFVVVLSLVCVIFGVVLLLTLR